jgi:hypothetical protein
VGGGISPGLDDRVEGAPVHHEVLEDGEGPCPPRLDVDRVAVLELAHVELADGGPFLAAVGDAVYDLRADAADPFPAVVIEDDRLVSFLDQVLVHDIEHLEEGVVLRDVSGRIGLEAAGLVLRALPPDDQLECHRSVFVLSAHYL